MTSRSPWWRNFQSGRSEQEAGDNWVQPMLIGRGPDADDLSPLWLVVIGAFVVAAVVSIACWIIL